MINQTCYELGSNRARNWQRYDLGGSTKLSFEEGVDSYVTYAGPLHDPKGRSAQTNVRSRRSTLAD